MGDAPLHLNQQQQQQEIRVHQEEHVNTNEQVFMEMRNDYEMLSQDKKRLGSHSKEYNDVKDSIEELIFMAETTVIAENSDAIGDQARNAVKMYDRAIQRCEAYVTSHRKAISSSGKRRVRMIQNLHQTLVRDKTNIQVIAGEHAQALAGHRWTEIMGLARNHSLDITNRADVTTAGDFTSQLLVIGHGNNTVFFKETDSLVSQDDLKKTYEKEAPTKGIREMIRKVTDMDAAGAIAFFLPLLQNEYTIEQLSASPEAYQNFPMKKELLHHSQMDQYLSVRDFEKNKEHIHYFFAYCNAQVKQKSIAWCGETGRY